MRNSTRPTSLQAILTGLPIATASLYLLGISFYQGFMRTVGLEESLFPLTVDRTLFNGFFALLDLSAPQIGYFLLAAELLALVALAAVSFSTSERVRRVVGTWFTKLPKRKNPAEQLEPPPQLTDFARFATRLLIYATIIFFVFLGVLFAGILADWSGQEIAKNFLKKVEGGKQPTIDLFLVGQEQPIKAHFILCSSTHCAFLTSKKTTIYRHELVEKTITHNITVNTDAAR